MLLDIHYLNDNFLESETFLDYTQANDFFKKNPTYHIVDVEEIDFSEYESRYLI